MADWFKRTEKNIQTTTSEKRDTPKGLWHKTPSGKIVGSEVLANNFYVSPEDDYHVRIGSKEYFELLFDDKYTELNPDIKPKDPLGFVDTQKYSERLKKAIEKTKLKDAMRTAVGNSYGRPLVLCCMDFSFIGGSMGSVVGEKIARAVDYAIANRCPFMIVSKSGGARMMESAFSLMQMAKTSAKLAELAEAKLPYISLCTDPTTGGVTASFAMLGDINISEPAALIGFAGPRIVKDATGKDLPEGFQTAEFLKEHGFLDFIVHRRELKAKVNLYIDLIMNAPVRSEVS